MAAAERHRRHVRLIVPGETEGVEDVNPFAKIYYIPAKFSPVFDKRYRIMMPWQYMVKDSVIRKILLAEKPDMIEVTDKYTLSLIGPMVRRRGFQQLGRPMLVHFSCERMDDNIASFLSGGKFGKWIAGRVIGNYTLPSFDYHLANSAYTAEEFYEALERGKNKTSTRFLDMCWRFFKAPRVPFDERIFVCPRGVDPVFFNPARTSPAAKSEMRKKVGIPAESVVLLYAGRVSPEKNIRLLPEMMAVLGKDRARDYRLLVAGAGPQSDWLKERGEKLAPGKIIVLGHLDKELLADYYANADVFVHPNPKEPFGIAPLEAMASGLPTVAPRAGGILSYATNENAWLVEPTGDAFAAAVREIQDYPEVSRAKVERAIETARLNTREASTDNLFATYDKIYEDFLLRNELFTDFDAPADFDYINLFQTAEIAKNTIIDS